MQTRNVGIGQFKDRSEKARFIDEATFARLKCFEVLPGDLLISRLPEPVGRACIIPDTGQKMITAVDCSIVRAHESSINPEFLVYYTQTQDYLRAVDVRCSGTTRKRISRKNLGNVPVPIPPMDEQERIVALLDQAFAALDRARAHAEANLADAEALFESKLHGAFVEIGSGVDRLRFDQLCEAITPKTKIKRQDYLAEGAYPVVSQEAAIVSGYWDDPDALLSVGQPVVVFGDHTRCLKYIDFDFVVGADGTKVLKPRKGVSAAYLYFGLRSQPIAGKGYARHFKFVREINLPDIPLLEQKNLAEKLFILEDECLRLSDTYEQKLANITDLRQSLLQKAFSGELI